MQNLILIITQHNNDNVGSNIFMYSCNEPFTVHLPEDTKKADHNKCEDKDKTYHNLEHTIQCENCEHRNTIYYCTDTHPILMTGDE